MNKYECYMTCPRGIENILSQEITQIINKKNVIDAGGVKFTGSNEDIYRLNYHSRVGMNLLIKLFEGNADNTDVLYKLIYDYDWHKLISPDKTFFIRSKINSRVIANQNFTTLKIKDAIVDRINKEVGSRPSIDKKYPDYYITIYIKEKRVMVYLNSSGKPLFKRGYRTKIHKAALNESLAAGLILLSNWNKEKPFYDIMCGSGTIPIEAAMMAYNIPPGILRKNFGFQKWDDYDSDLWSRIVTNAKEKISFKNEIPIYGSDYFNKNIELAIHSAKQINLNQKIKFKSLNINDFKPESNSGVIIINPPYGNRIGDQEIINRLYKNIGDIFKTYCIGFDTYIFTGNLDAIKSIGLRSRRRIILKNGKIDCRLLYYPISSGKFK